MTTRWLFGDQLGPHFTEDHRGPLVMVESKAVFRRRPTVLSGRSRPEVAFHLRQRW